MVNSRFKFRAWDNEDKKMWKVVAISDSIWGDCEEAHIRICDFDKSPGDKETNVRLSVNFDLMQYTGLKDKNGRDIYEGDVVQVKLYFGLAKFKVIFANGGFYFNGISEKSSGYSRFIYEYKDFDVEAIGNIYENPELIKGVNA